MLVNLKRVGRKIIMPAGTSRFLLVPDLRAEQFHTSLYNAVVLANLWRLRRGRPYLIGQITESDPAYGFTDLERKYIESLPLLEETRIEPNDIIRTRYIGDGDPAPFLPLYEEDFILCLPSAPPAKLPSKIKTLFDLHGLFIGRTDEFITVDTDDPDIEQLVEKLPEWEPIPELHRYGGQSPTREGVIRD